jgi:hypothetical protein
MVDLGGVLAADRGDDDAGNQPEPPAPVEDSGTGAPCCRLRGQPNRSMMVALAMPPPSHIVCSPYRPLYCSKALVSVFG